jgi:hypothetical protein
MIASVFEVAIAAAMAMTPRQFAAAKCFAHPEILYALHGDGRGRLLAVGRDYRPVGLPSDQGCRHADYADERFDCIRIQDSPAVRGLATQINPAGRSSLRGGVRVPILALIDARDTRQTYCARLRALIKALR